MNRWLLFLISIGVLLALVGCGMAGDKTVARISSPDDVQRILPSEAKSMLDEDDAVLYDARGAEWYDGEHAAGAVSLPESDVAARFDSLPRDAALIFYCT